MNFFLKFKFVWLSIGPRLVEASQLQLTANKIIITGAQPKAGHRL